MNINYKAMKRLRKTLFYFLVIFVFIVYVFPVYWVVSTSFKQEKDAISIPPKFLFKPTLENYRKAFLEKGLLPNFYNSLIVTLGSTTLALLAGIPAAYALSRFNIPRKEDLSFWFLSTRMAPPVLAAIPFFVYSRRWGLYDTKIILIIVGMLVNLSWVVWMMRSFFEDIPTSIDEAAMIDGCNRFQALMKVVLPIAKPGLAATTIFSVILSWNEYFFALVLTSVRAKTLPAAITTFLTIHGLLWGEMCAAGTIVMLPILIFVAVLQKHLVRGMTMGAVRE